MINPYLKQLNTTVFDIETMGLTPNSDMVICASFFDPETNTLEQMFAESPQDEKSLLEQIIAKLSVYDAVITYNGDRFDIPFVKTRCKKYGMDFFPVFFSVDMYRYLKSYWPMAERMPHLNQKSVEFALGLSDSREDKIGGDECIGLYSSYVSGANSDAKDIILLHNADDVRQLGGIYKASNFLPFDRIAFERGFPIKQERLIICDAISIQKNCITVKAKRCGGGIAASIYKDAFEYDYNPLNGDIVLRINLQSKDQLKFVDLLQIFDDDNEFKNERGYHSGFLVLADGDNVLYNELNHLIKDLLVLLDNC